MLKYNSMFIGVALLMASAAYGADSGSITAPSSNDAWIFSAPPRESPEEAVRVYQPLIDYLSKVTGKRIVLKYPRTWGVYRTEMINGRYDLVFDGPHFNGYRAEKLHHTVLVKLSDAREFVIVARKDEKVTAPADLAGRTFCTQSPPNLAALVALSQFDNPQRQPILVPTKGFDKIYSGVVSGRCAGGVLSTSNLDVLDKDGVLKVLYKSPSMPEQALSAGPRVSAADKAKIVTALTSPEGVVPTEKLRAAAKGGASFLAANNREYAGLGDLLKREWGFYDN